MKIVIDYIFFKIYNKSSVDEDTCFKKITLSELRTV